MSDPRKENGVCGYTTWSEVRDGRYDWTWVSGCGEEAGQDSNQIAIWDYCPYCGDRMFVEDSDVHEIE